MLKSRFGDHSTMEGWLKAIALGQSEAPGLGLYDPSQESQETLKSRLCCRREHLTSNIKVNTTRYSVVNSTCDVPKKYCSISGSKYRIKEEAVSLMILTIRWNLLLRIGHPYCLSLYMSRGSTYTYGYKHQYECHHCNHSPIFRSRWCSGIGAYRNTCTWACDGE